ncbi:MAG: hypothetical protein ACXVDD_04955 [Polyangia bacterium]
MRNDLCLALLVLAVAGCGGETSQNGESGDPFSIVNNNCKVANPGYISLDQFDAGSRRFVGGVNYEVYGEPLSLHVDATAHALYPGSGPSQFPHTIVLDGVGQTEQLSYAWGTTLLQTDLSIWGSTLEPSTADVHTASLTSACGTETRSLTITKIAATAPVPSLNVSATYVSSGASVDLTGATGLSYSTCVVARAHLVGRQDYDGKVVLDETYEPNQLYSWHKTVKPAIDTTYTLTMSCALAMYAAPQMVSKHVQVYGGNGAVCGGAAPMAWQFCQTCPSSVDFYPPWKTTLVETACSYADAKSGAQNMGTNCTLTDGPCS